MHSVETRTIHQRESNVIFLRNIQLTFQTSISQRSETMGKSLGKSNLKTRTFRIVGVGRTFFKTHDIGSQGSWFATSPRHHCLTLGRYFIICFRRICNTRFPSFCARHCQTSNTELETLCGEKVFQNLTRIRNFVDHRFFSRNLVVLDEKLHWSFLSI